MLNVGLHFNETDFIGKIVELLEQQIFALILKAIMVFVLE